MPSGWRSVGMMLRAATRVARLARRNPPALPRPAPCSSLASTPPAASPPPPPRVLYHFHYVRHLRQLLRMKVRLRGNAWRVLCTHQRRACTAHDA